MADHAIEALQNAGFSADQIRHSGDMASDNQNSFLASVKSLFTGEDAGSDNVRRELMNMGFSQGEADYYANEFNAGRSFVAVDATGREQEAVSILRSNGAHDYDMRSTAGQTGGYAQAGSYTTTGYGQSYASSGTGASSYSQPTYQDQASYGQSSYSQPAYQGQAEASQTDYNNDVDTDDNRRLRLREERLEAEKSTVQSGEVRLHKNVVEEQQTINVPVKKEEVYIEQHPVNGDQVSDTPIGENETIRVPVREEQVNITKTPYVKGEVNIGKRTAEENREFSDNVRREEARVEREGNPSIRSNDLDNA
jgi:uncharacterized protein (TIGR02271 family)